MTVEQEDAQARGSLADTPFVHLVLFVYRQGASGTLELRDGFGLDAAVLIRQGRPVAVRSAFGGSDFTSALLELCGLRSGEFAFYRSDRLESADHAGTIDPYALLYASLREYAREEVVDGVIARYPTSRLMLQPDRDVSRLGLDEIDGALIARLRLRPATVEELIAWSHAGIEHARRLVYALLVTHMVAPQEDRVDALYRSQVIEQPVTATESAAQPMPVARASGAPDAGPVPARTTSPGYASPAPPRASHVPSAPASMRSAPPRPPSAPTSTAPRPASGPISAPPRPPSGPASVPPRVPSAVPPAVPPRISMQPPTTSIRPGASRSMPPIGGVNEVASASMPAWQRLVAISQASASMRPPAGGAPPTTGTQPVFRPPAPGRASISGAMNDPATRRKRADQFYQSSRFVEALALIEDLCKENPKDATLHGQRARALFEVHRNEPGGLPRSIVDAVRKAHELDGEEPHAFFAKGLVYKQAGELAKAVSCFRRVLLVDPKNIDAQREIRLAKMRG